MRGRFVVVLAVLAALLSTLNCRKPVGAQTSRVEGVVRVATYNMQWFSEDANPKRIDNLRSVLSHVSADVMGLQEVQSEKALRQILDDQWDIGMVDDDSDQQELAIAVKKPCVLVSTEPVFPSDSLDDAFPKNRDVLRCVIQTRDDRKLVVYVVHMKSRRGGRLSTDHQRIMACGLLAAYLRGRADEESALVLGDFNDNPRDASLNVLESGDLMAKGGQNSNEQRLLKNLTEPLVDKDFVTESVHELFSGSLIKPIAKGSAEDNDRLRGQEYEFPRDVRVPQIMFDQILATPALAAASTEPTIYCEPDALRGEAGRTSVTGSGVTYSYKGDLASDHLPVYVDVRVP